MTFPSSRRFGPSSFKLQASPPNAHRRSLTRPPFGLFVTQETLPNHLPRRYFPLGIPSSRYRPRTAPRGCVVAPLRSLFFPATPTPLFLPSSLPRGCAFISSRPRLKSITRLPNSGHDTRAVDGSVNSTTPSATGTSKSAMLRTMTRLFRGAEHSTILAAVTSPTRSTGGSPLSEWSHSLPLASMAGQSRRR